MPNSAELATAACAAPPVSRPVSRLASLSSSSPAPDAVSTAPNTMKIRMLPDTTCRGWPNMPPVCAQKFCTIARRCCAGVASVPANTPVHSGSWPRTKKYAIQNAQKATMKPPNSRYVR